MVLPLDLSPMLTLSKEKVPYIAHQPIPIEYYGLHCDPMENFLTRNCVHDMGSKLALITAKASRREVLLLCGLYISCKL